MKILLRYKPTDGRPWASLLREVGSHHSDDELILLITGASIASVESVILSAFFAENARQALTIRYTPTRHYDSMIESTLGATVQGRTFIHTREGTP